MEIDPHNGLIVRPLDQFGSSCRWMRDQIEQRGIRIHHGSPLSVQLRALEELRARMPDDDRFRADSLEECYEYMAGIYGTDFLSKAIHWGATSGLQLDETRWRQLGRADPLITRKCPTSSKDRNETWDIVLACLAATFATDVSFAEPDVTCTYGGRRYAIAAKVAYSKASLFDNIEKGFAQARSKAEAVLVFVDVVSLYPQVETLRWSLSRRFSHNDEAVSVMKDSVRRWCTNWPLESLLRKLRARATEPVSVAFFVPMLLFLDGAPRPFHYTHLPLVLDNEDLDDGFAHAFLRACNVVASFAPGVDMGSILGCLHPNGGPS